MFVVVTKSHHCIGTTNHSIESKLNQYKVWGLTGSQRHGRHHSDIHSTLWYSLKDCNSGSASLGHRKSLQHRVPDVLWGKVFKCIVLMSQIQIPLTKSPIRSSQYSSVARCCQLQHCVHPDI